MEHIIQMTVSVEDEAIVKRVHDTAEKQIISNITEKVMDIITEKRYAGYYKRDCTVTFDPLHKMVKEKIDEILKENKDFIVNGAIQELANKLSRTKAVKEAAARKVEEVLKP